MSDTGVRAPLRRRHLGMAIGKAADVGLVDHGVVPRGAGPAIVRPLEGGVDDYRLWHRGRGIGPVDDAVITVREVVAVYGLVPVDLSGHGLGVGVEEELGVVGPKT